MRAGLDGLVRHLAPPAPCDLDLLQCPQEIRAQYPALPQSLSEARELLQKSEFVKEALPQHLFSAYAEQL